MSSQDRLAGKRILITSAEDYMGPAITELFESEGADVVTDTGALTEQEPRPVSLPSPVPWMS